jgi:hypothetical protein
MLTARPAAAAALLAAVAPAAATAQVIAGRVIDASSGAAVARATVTVDGAGAPHTLSDGGGRFSIVPGRAGSYRVRVERAGYRDARSRELSVGAGDTAWVEVRVTPAAFELRALDVTAQKRPLEVTGRFRKTRPPPAAAAAPVRGEGRRRAIGVQGNFPTPSVCFDLAGVADRTGNVVTLVVEARPGQSTCANAAGALAYSLTLRELPPGAYTFRVFHALRTRPGEREMLLDTTVAVR